MPAGLVTPDDVGTLLQLVEQDRDRRCAEAALSVAVSLPLDALAAQQCAPVVRRLLADPRRLSPTVVDQAARQLGTIDTAQAAAGARAFGRRSGERPGERPASASDAHAVAQRVEARLLWRGKFPRDLTPLMALPGDEAERLLSALVERLVLAARELDPVLAAATERLGDVVSGLTAGGGRVVTAHLPTLEQAVPIQRRAWLGGLLTLVEPAEVLHAVRPQITTPSVWRRLTALRRLKAAAPHLAGRRCHCRHPERARTISPRSPSWSRPRSPGPGPSAGGGSRNAQAGAPTVKHWEAVASIAPDSRPVKARSRRAPVASLRRARTVPAALEA
jgi:hypothetical protein